MSAPARLDADPAPLDARLVALFEHIAQTRMAGVPVVNDALGVALRGWRDFGPYALGMLVTPWFMNLVAFPQGEAPRGTRVGDKAHLALPSGAYEAIWAYEEAVGGYWTVSLFSPMFEFDSMEAAMATADAALEEIMAEPEPAPAPAPEKRAVPVSRRALFRLGGAAEMTDKA